MTGTQSDKVKLISFFEVVNVSVLGVQKRICCIHYKSFMEALVCELDPEELVRFALTLFKIISIVSY